MSEGWKPLGAGLGPVFAKLERRAKVHVDLTERVRGLLEGPEKEHVVSVTCRQDTLVVLTDASVWCPRIRYAQKELLERLRASGETQFTKLKVRVGRGAV